jgi:hypothetical protein
MASNYASFYVKSETTAGEINSVGAGVSVKVRKEGAGSDEAESPLTTNASGQIVAGSLASVPVGTTVHFRVEQKDGMAASIAQVTT